MREVERISGRERERWREGEVEVERGRGKDGASIEGVDCGFVCSPCCDQGR